jgi:hypothetical protein
MDDNTFECPNCGAKVYPEMTRCPQCGQNMYPEEGDERAARVESAWASWMADLGALVIGWMIAGGIALLLHFIVSSFVAPAMLGLTSKVVLLSAGPVGAFTGGFVAVGIDRRRGRWLGVAVAVLVLPVLAIFATHWVDVSFTFLLSLGVITDGVATVLAGFFGGRLNYKLFQDTGWKEKWQVRGWEDLLYQDLLRRTRFNGSAADRLIEYERKQDPQASRLKLIQSAIERWERDNR